MTHQLKPKFVLLMNQSKINRHHCLCLQPKFSNNYQYHSAMLDEDYLLVGNYVDDTLKRKIGNGEYVDFAKLMPKEKASDEDHQMVLVNKGGYSYWMPVADREMTNINGYGKWEQAFHVFSNIYTAYHPTSSGELIQYNHIIHMASQTYHWENVYHYDKEFRTHMSRHHLNQSWGVILQQAWAMFLKDKISGNNHGSSRNNGNGSGGPRRKLCFDFNRGYCSFRKKCKFEHRCFILQ